jgi:hypothetical protein
MPSSRSCSPRTPRSASGACPLHARSNGKSREIAVTHGQADTPPTCDNPAQRIRTRSLTRKRRYGDFRHREPRLVGLYRLCSAAGSGPCIVKALSRHDRAMTCSLRLLAIVSWHPRCRRATSLKACSLSTYGALPGHFGGTSARDPPRNAENCRDLIPRSGSMPGSFTKVSDTLAQDPAKRPTPNMLLTCSGTLDA